MPKKALVILAEGFEEIEAVTPIDLLKRAGVDVTTAGVGNTKIKGARVQITVLTDKKIEDVSKDFDAVILPGGMPGASNLAASKAVNEIVQDANTNGKIIAAICAAPAVVLTPLGILKNKTATCFPGMEKQFDKTTLFKEEPVVIDGNIITSRGAGTAYAFALTIVEKLVGKDIAQKVKKETVAG
ncbi:MAG: DJ-1/PfpI family protein [Candidatus Omnitrophica bacterium]|nr:DJ-1/PfpI family protein [Candidatus Omnitrophota bacterium]